MLERKSLLIGAIAATFFTTLAMDSAGHRADSLSNPIGCGVFAYATGALIGTASAGGARNSGLGGTIFEVTP